MTEDITPQNIYQDEDIYVNLSDKELKDLYEDLEAGFLEWKKNKNWDVV